MRLPKKGTLVQVEWIDATKKDYVVLASSLYQDDVGDFTVLPRGMIQEVRLLLASPRK